MSKISDPFIFRAETSNHQQDVRWVAPGSAPDHILTSSRDKTARCFSFSNDAADGFHDVLTPEGPVMEGHQGFVNFVLYHPSVAFLDGEPAIITGSNDKYVIFWSLAHTMEAILGGHTDTVKCAAVLYPSMDVVTGGWDKAAVVWDIASGEIKQHTAHHQQGVLSVAQVGPRTDPANQVVVTASGDRTLCAWEASTAVVVRVFKGHTDAVQAVVAIGEKGRFASASNDGRIGIWHLDAEAPLFFLQAHEAFIFTLSYMPSTNELISGGDDRTVKVWAVDETAGLACTQVVNLPSTVWCVCAVPDGSAAAGAEGGGPAYTEQIAVGTADATVRLFSRNLDMCAAPEKIAALEALVSGQTIDVKALLAAGYTLDYGAMPLLAACGEVEGQYEGERKLFKVEEGGAVEVYTWAGGTWEKIGTVVIVVNDVQQAYRGTVPKQRVFYNGQEWDYVFDIDFGGGRSAKMPYNSGESIFDAAQRFINDNAAIGAMQSHKEALQNHILQGLSEEDLAKIGVASGKAGAAGGGSVAVSEYAKEAAEMARQGIQETPSWGQAKKKLETGGGGDVAVSTFMQEEAAAARAAALGGARVPTTSSTAAALSASAPTAELFAALDPAAVKRKTSELCGGSSVHDVVIDAAASAVATKGADSAMLEMVSEGIARLYAALPQGSRFPAIDLLRHVCTVREASVGIVGGSGGRGGSKGASEVVEGLLADDKAFVETVLTSEPERLVGLRLLANMAGTISSPTAGPSAAPSYSPSAALAAVSFFTKALQNAVRPMAKRSATNANQRLAIAAFLANLGAGLGTLCSSAAATVGAEESDNAASAVEEGAAADLIDAFVKAYFLSISEAILFEKEPSMQAKYLNAALIALNSSVGSAPAGSSSAAAAPCTPSPASASAVATVVVGHATSTLQRFCASAARHIDKGLATAASGVFQYVKPSENKFEY